MLRNKKVIENSSCYWPPPIITNKLLLLHFGKALAVDGVLAVNIRCGKSFIKFPNVQVSDATGDAHRYFSLAQNFLLYLLFNYLNWKVVAIAITRRVLRAAFVFLRQFGHLYFESQILNYIEIQRFPLAKNFQECPHCLILSKASPIPPPSLHPTFASLLHDRW